MSIAQTLETAQAHLKATMISHSIRGDNRRQQRGFIAQRVLGDFGQRDIIKTDQVDQLLKKYTTPEAFWRSAMRFVYGSNSITIAGSFEPNKLEQKKRQYFLELQQLGKQMFGQEWSNFEKKGLSEVEPEVASSSISSYPENEDMPMIPINSPVSGDSHYHRMAVGVVDGMGGYQGGKDAAKIVASEANLQMVQFLNHGRPFSENVMKLMRNSIDRMKKCAETPEMGATFAMVGMADKKIFTAHGGDSKIAVLTEDGKVKYLTVDHNLAHSYFTKGQITKEEWEKITKIIDTARSASDIPPEYRKFWYSENKDEGRKVVDPNRTLSSVTELPRLEELVGAHIIKTHEVEHDWVCVLALTDGVTDNLTPDEIATTMNSADLIAGRTTLKVSLEQLTSLARQRAVEGKFRSKKDKGITASGFMI